MRRRMTTISANTSSELRASFVSRRHSHARHGSALDDDAHRTGVDIRARVVIVGGVRAARRRGAAMSRRDPSGVAARVSPPQRDGAGGDAPERHGW